MRQANSAVSRQPKGRKAPPNIKPPTRSKIDQLMSVYEHGRDFLPARFTDKIDSALGMFKTVRNALTPFGQMDSRGVTIGTPESSQNLFNMNSFEFRSGGKDMHGAYTEAQGCEYVANIQGSASSSLFFNSPVTGATFNAIGFNTDAVNGRLGQISGLFDAFQFQWIMLEYVPFCSVTQPGGFVMGYIEDGEPAATPAPSYQVVERMRPSVVCKFAGGCLLPIKVVDKAKVYTTEYLKSGDRLLDCVQGTLYGYPQGSSVDTTTVFGQLMMHYNVRLYKPSFQLYPAISREMALVYSSLSPSDRKALVGLANKMLVCANQRKLQDTKSDDNGRLVLINGAPVNLQDPIPVPPTPIPPRTFEEVKVKETPVGPNPYTLSTGQLAELTALLSPGQLAELTALVNGSLSSSEQDLLARGVAIDVLRPGWSSAQSLLNRHHLATRELSGFPRPARPVCPPRGETACESDFVTIESSVSSRSAC